MKWFFVFFLTGLICSCRKDPSIEASNNLQYQKNFAPELALYYYELNFISSLAIFIYENHGSLGFENNESIPLNFLIPECVKIRALDLDSLDGIKDGWPKKIEININSKPCIFSDNKNRNGIININLNGIREKKYPANFYSFSLFNYSVNEIILFTAPMIQYYEGTDSFRIKVMNSSLISSYDSLNTINANLTFRKTGSGGKINYTIRGEVNGKDEAQNPFFSKIDIQNGLTFSGSCGYLTGGKIRVQRNNKIYFISFPDTCSEFFKINNNIDTIGLSFNDYRKN